MLSCRRSRSTRASWPTSAGRSSASARYSWVMRKRFSAVSVITSQRSTPIILPTSVTVACKKWSTLMTEKVSEPMRLRIASRASCISSLRSSESVSLIYLPCESQRIAFTAVRIAHFDFDGCSGWYRSLWDAGQKCGAVIAARLGGIGDLSYDHLHSLLHGRAVDDELLILRLVGELCQPGRGDVQLS